jgi:hypothetical protein
MNLSPPTLLRAARDTLVNPAGAARYVMDLGLSTRQGLMALALTAVLATLLTALMQAFIGPVDDAGMQGLFNRPFILALSQFGLMILGAALMWRVGQMFGGKGSFAQSLSLVAWLEVVLILLQLAQVLVLLALPVLSLPIGLASVFAFFYLLTHFTAALNGFTSLTKTFFAILGTSLAVLFLASIALMFILPVPNV